MPGFTYPATSVKNLNEAAALGGLACLYCCADAFFFFFFFAGSPTLLLSFESLSFWTILKADWELLEAAMVQELITVPLLGIFFF